MLSFFPGMLRDRRIEDGDWIVSNADLNYSWIGNNREVRSRVSRALRYSTRINLSSEKTSIKRTYQNRRVTETGDSASTDGDRRML